MKTKIRSLIFRSFFIRLKPVAANMVDFIKEPTDVTPSNYFEGPVMMKKNGTYYLMYSNGKAIDHTYNVRYATSSSPWGPFEEDFNSPVLKTSADSTTYGPGHQIRLGFRCTVM